MARQPGFAALTGSVFAATMLIVVGVFEIIDGITAIVHDNFFVTVRNYTFNLDTTAWGWIHLALGALLLLTGIALMSWRPWAAVAGIVLAGLSAINNFFFLPHYPFWSIVLIAVNVFVIWSLATMLDARMGASREAPAAPAGQQRWPQTSGSSAAADVQERPARHEASTTQQNQQQQPPSMPRG